ncbi:MAG: hypothetical protein AAGJ97_09910, partial [Planctomycetota bacterium]
QPDGADIISAERIDGPSLQIEMLVFFGISAFEIDRLPQTNRIVVTQSDVTGPDVPRKYMVTFSSNPCGRLSTRVERLAKHSCRNGTLGFCHDITAMIRPLIDSRMPSVTTVRTPLESSIHLRA